MKGYTSVTTDQMQTAVTNWKERYELGSELVDKGIDLYYAKYYTNGKWFTRLFNSKKSPEDFVKSRINMFYSWDSVLHEVLTKEETEALWFWCYDLHKDACKAVASLLKCSTDGTALLDDQLCRFVDKYK